MDRRTLILLTLAAASGVLVAGPLTPPAGPVASSYKTLSEVEPRVAVNGANTPGDVDNVFKITAPGSYYLPGNLAVPAGKIGIRIACSDVTLDLSGFTISGGGIGIAGIPMVLPGSISNIRVVHGSVRGATSTGVGMFTASPARVEGVTAIACDTGFYSADRCEFDGCRAEGGQIGFQTGNKCSLTGCVATGASSFGFSLIGDGNSVTRCLADGNGQDGFGIGNGSSITNCTAHGNGGAGIIAYTHCVIADCVARGNGGSGVYAGGGCVIRNTTSGESGLHGFEILSKVSIEGCTAEESGQDGIHAGWHCRVSGNTCIDNGQAVATGAGIRLTSFGCRVEENHCAGNDKGIVAAGSDNVIVRNSAGGNAAGSYDIVAGNELAPVVSNPGSNAFATTNAWSNLAY